MVSDDGKFRDLREVIDDDDYPRFDELVRASRLSCFAVLAGGLSVSGVWNPEGAARVHEDVFERAIEVKGLRVFDL